jgi:hypothetical protein
VSRATRAWVPASTLLVLALSAAQWVAQPDHAWRWLAAAATVALGWLVLRLAERRPTRTTSSQRDLLALAVVAAGLLLAAALAISLAGALGFDTGALPARARGLAVGLALLAQGNALPRALEPLNVANLAAAGEAQAARRWTGWVLSLAGVACVALFSFAPLHGAEVASAMVTAAALLLILGRQSSARAPPPTSGTAPPSR